MPTAGFVLFFVFVALLALLVSRTTANPELSRTSGFMMSGLLNPNINPFSLQQPDKVYYELKVEDEVEVIVQKPSGTIREEELHQRIAEADNPIDLKAIENHLYELEEPLIALTEKENCENWVAADLEILSRLKTSVQKKIGTCTFTKESFMEFINQKHQWHELLTPTMKELAVKFNCFPQLVYRSLDLRYPENTTL